MGMKTTVEKCLPIIQLIKYMGVFPYSIVHPLERLDCTISPSRKQNPSFQIDNSWKSTLKCIIVQTYFGTRLAFGYTQIFRAAVFGVDFKFTTGISAICSNLVATCAFGITLVSIRNKIQLTALLNQWKETEMEIDSFPKRMLCIY